MDGRAKAGRIAQPVPGSALHKLLSKRLGLPHRVAYPVVRAAKIAGNPARFWAGRRMARGVAAPAGGDDFLRAEGYRQLAPGDLPGVDAAVAVCRALFEQARGAPVEPLVRNPKKLFLLSILAGSDFVDHPRLIEFMVSRPVLDIATEYLGCVPILAGANLWWSRPSSEAHASQLFHLDNEDSRILKLFVNVTDVTAENGPLTFLPATISRQVEKAAGYGRHGTGRLRDEQVEAAGAAGKSLSLIGPAGTAAFVDPGRCLHFGSRVEKGDRVVLAIQFLRFHAPNEATLPLRVPAGFAGFEWDPHQKLALGLK